VEQLACLLGLHEEVIAEEQNVMAFESCNVKKVLWFVTLDAKMTSRMSLKTCSGHSLSFQT
jgi:hypothetical protein